MGQALCRGAGGVNDRDLAEKLAVRGDEPLPLFDPAAPLLDPVDLDEES